MLHGGTLFIAPLKSQLARNTQVFNRSHIHYMVIINNHIMNNHLWITLFFCFFVLFHSCCSLARVFGRTLLHELHISYSHTEWCLLVFDSATKEDIGIKQQLYEIVRGKNFALNCLSWKFTEMIMITNEFIPENLVVVR